MADMMVINTINIFALNFDIGYARMGKLQLGYQATRKLVANRYRVKEVSIPDRYGTDTDKVALVGDEPRFTGKH